jgi:hypothetical protein
MSDDTASPAGMFRDGPPSDAELLARADAGDGAAFAVLVHRHAATLHATATASGSDDPEAEVVATLSRAMRQLDTAPTEDVAGWLVGLQARRRGVTGEVPDLDQVTTLQERVLDAIWAELAPRWPTGRRPVRLPRWVGHVALVALLLVLSVAVPYLLLVTAADPASGPAPLAEVVAEPLEDDGWPED